MIEILTDDWLENFFNAVNDDLILKRRESHCIEFKQQFDWENKKAKAKYAKSMAAFANHRGGAIFFGIKDTPHKIIGIQNYDSVDDADITNFLSEIFSPSLHF